MNSFILLPSEVNIRKSSYFSGFFIILEWHLCITARVLMLGNTWLM